MKPGTKELPIWLSHIPGTGRELDQKWSSWVELGAHEVCQCHRWQLYPLCHNADPKHAVFSKKMFLDQRLCDSYLLKCMVNLEGNDIFNNVT